MRANILNEIIKNKQQEIRLLDRRAIAQALDSFNNTKSKSFKDSLLTGSTKNIGVIAEIKRNSPSKGIIATIAEPVALAKSYVNGGANAISVLTDHKFFGGSLDDLSKVATALRDMPCPVLRKDFILDEIQIVESILAGADAVLLIVSVLQHQTKHLLDVAKRMNIDALVEVHNREELELAIDSGAEIIGINNRDLKTFKVDINRSLELVQFIPQEIIAVAESGINSPEASRQLRAAGFDALLIGEALVTASNPITTIKQLRGGV